MSHKEPHFQATLKDRTTPRLPSGDGLCGIWGVDLALPDQSIASGAVVFEKDSIRAIGTLDSVVGSLGGSPVSWIDGRGFVVGPGLINAHTHVAMSYLRGLALGKDDVIMRLMFGTEKHLTAELVRALSYPGIYEGLLGGSTCFVDHYYFADAVAQALDHFGVRGIVGETVGDISTAFPGKDRWKLARNQIENWKTSGRVQPLVAPHAANTVSESLLKEMADYARKQKLPMHLHLAQTDSERDWCIKHYGISPVQLANRAGALGDHTLAVHLISVDQEDLATLAQSHAAAGWCPASQILYERMADGRAFLENKIPVALGTDCAVSNDSMHLLSEMRLAALMLLDRGYSKKDTVEAVWRMVTLTPSQVFSLPKLGSLTKGSAADLICIEKDFSLEPVYDLRHWMVFSASQARVNHTLVDGQWVLWDQKPTRVDLEQARKEFSKALETIWSLQEIPWRQM